MQFNSLTFGIFFIFVCAAYWLLRSWSARKTLLLFASYLFYAAWNPLYVTLIAFSTVVDWFIARGMLRSDKDRVRLLLLVGSLAANLGLLGFFKYAGFLLDIFTNFVSAFGFTYQPPAYDIVLPVGISFYTFQTLSYTIDVYRRHITRAPSLRDFSLYVAFFPQLVAGPIVRAAHFLPQLLTARPFDSRYVNIGIAFIVVGLFQKVVLADGILAPVADDTFSAYYVVGAFQAWAGVLAFGGQIFFDFSGYSTIAIGAALCLGFAIPDNFQKPYAAAGFSDFWSRWHISLSTWFRDYLYIPLGGNRSGAGKTCRNLMITMLLAGLWHGASWMFVIWGALHGAMLVMERVSGDRWSSLPLSLRVLITFVAVHIAWVFFRAQDMVSAVGVLKGLVAVDGWGALESAAIIAVAVVCINVTYQVLFRHERLQESLDRIRPLPRGILFAVMLVLIYLYSGGDERAFIYFQF